METACPGNSSIYSGDASRSDTMHGAGGQAAGVNGSCGQGGGGDGGGEDTDMARNLVIFSVGVTLGVVIIMTNMTVIVTLARYRRLMISLRFFILNMAATDGVVGALFIYDATMANLVGVSFLVECLLRSGVITTVMLASMMTITMMAIDRALPIYFPYRYSAYLTATKLLVAILSMWVVAIFLGVVPYFVFPMTSIKQCQAFVFPYNLPLAVHVSAWYVLLAVQLVSNVLIYYAAKKHIRRIVPTHVHADTAGGGDGDVKQSRTRFRMHLKATATVVMVLVTFIVCWAPVMVYFTYRLVSRDANFTADHQVLTLNALLLFALINSLLNPLIYGYKFRSVRRAFQTVFCCAKRDHWDPTLSMNVA